MTASSEERDADFPAQLGIPLLSMALGFALIYAFVANGLHSINAFWGPQGERALSAFAINLLIVGMIRGFSRRRPTPIRTIGSLVLLAFVAFMVAGATLSILNNMRANDFLRWWYWKTLGLLLANLLVFAGAIWGMCRLKPWQTLKLPAEPVSPATRKTKLLFGLSGGVSILALVALSLGTHSNHGGFAVLSNREDVSPLFALVAILIWLLSIAIAWWWYASADEHERRANDVGFLFGGGLFMAVTPVWWIAARAGLLPPPDAMILWYVTVVAMGIGWAWYRNR